mgnify:CR=1 FL=1
MSMEKNAFTLLVRPIRKLLEERGFYEPTDPQNEAIPKILEGKNVLLISPTATGKTEAAILPVLSMAIQSPRKGRGIMVLYITPLRALNRDMLDRLQWWCKNLDLKLAVRHGDTETRERTRQARSPPDILITTPETLQAILPGWVMRQHLRNVKYVIVDEVHELADSKRGSQLTLALERLRMLTNEDFQVIGLSATIGSPERVAKFLVGANRDVEIIKVSAARMMDIKILYPKPEREDFKLASQLYTHPEVASRLRVIKNLIEGQRSVLLFTNTRSISEVLTSRFKVWNMDLPISIHHGSLAKPSRVAAERGLKDGSLRGLICTSSLELGIDIGHVDMVIQYMSPRQVTRLVQRVGRSGHRIGRIAKGVIITMDPDDTLESMVIAKKALREDLEPVKIPPKPYDVLTHQIAGLLIRRKRWYFREILELFRNAYPYSDLTLEELERTLEYMNARFPRLAWISKDDQVALKPLRTKALYEYYFSNLSMIPEERNYLVVDETNDTAVGILDEAFVSEYGKPGVKFIIRGSPWKIHSVRGDRIYVRAVDDPTGAIPSWIGEEIPVPFDVAQEVGRIRAFIESCVEEGMQLEEVAARIAEEYPVDSETAKNAIESTYNQASLGYTVPTDKRIVLEDWEDFVVIHAHLGSLTNRALAQLLGHIIGEELGYAVTVQHDPYRILLQTMGDLHSYEVKELFEELKSMDEMDIRELLIKAISKTGIFKRRIVHVARRFGAIEKQADVSRISLSSLIRSFEDTVIYDEALKEVLTKDVDIDHLLLLFKMIKRGEVEIVRIETYGEATPLAKQGIEKVHMKTDIIPPERLRMLILQSTKARLLNETRTFLCTECWGFIEEIRMKDLPDTPKCPKCGSRRLGLLNLTEDEAYSLIEKKGKKLTKDERRIAKRALETAKLISKYGKPAAIALSARIFHLEDVEKILEAESKATDRFYDLVIEGEKKALMKGFW